MDVQFTALSKRKNSTARPSSYSATLNCQLKEPCAVNSPVLIISQGAFSTSYNYAYIAAWGRYYFVSDVTFLTGQRVEVALSCDVLATYKDQIAAYTCFVERTSDGGYYNTYVQDEYLSNTTRITNSQIRETALTGLDPVTGFFVLRTVCKTGSYSGIASYALSGTQLANVLSFMFDDGNFTDVITDESVKAFFNPFQYIVDIKWIPYDFDTYSGALINSENVKFGWWTSSQSGHVIDTSVPGVPFYASTITLPTNQYSDWRHYSDRFSVYNIYLPAVGTVSLTAGETWEGLCVTYDLDVISGEALVKLYSGELSDTTSGRVPTGVLIASYKTTMSVPIQIGQLNSTASKTVSGAASVIGDILSFDWGRAAETAVQTTATALQPTPSINGTTGDRYTLLQNRNIAVSVNNLESCEYPTSQAGRPTYRNIQLGNLSGYVKCGNASLAASGYDADMEQVNAYLNGGFYME